MMLAAVPGQVGDGAQATLNYTKTDGSTVAIDTYVGKTPAADTLRRFLVGPVDCEITGCAETPDGKTLFVNIQHPGETIGRGRRGRPDQVPEPLAGQRRLRRRRCDARGRARPPSSSPRTTAASSAAERRTAQRAVAGGGAMLRAPFATARCACAC